MSRAAREEAWNHFGLTPAAMQGVLLRLSSRDFHHEEASHRHPGVPIWFFHTTLRDPLDACFTARILIREMPNWYVIKFHRDIFSDEDR